MTNLETMHSEFWKLFGILQNDLGWEYTLDPFGIEDETIMMEFKKNKTLDKFVEDLMNSKIGISFDILGMKTTFVDETRMALALKLGYIMHQEHVENITLDYNNPIEMDDLYFQYDVNKYFAVITDFFTDEHMSKTLGFNKFSKESFIYFSVVIGYLVHSQLVKIRLNEENEMIERRPVKRISSDLLLQYLIRTGILGSRE